MSRPPLVPEAVWMVAVSLGGTLAPLGRVTVAEPARSFHPARSTAELLLFWSVTMTSAVVAWPPVMRTGEAALAVAAAGDAPAATVATAGDAPATAVPATGDAAATAVPATGEAAT